MAANIYVANTNAKVVEQLEEGFNAVKYEDPVFNHHGQLESYVQSLEHESPTERQLKVTGFLNPILDRVLNVWSDKYTANTELIRQANREKTTLEGMRTENELSLAHLKDQVNEEEAKVEALKENKNKFLGAVPGGGGEVHWGGEITSVVFSLIITFLLAISTMYVYLDAQADLWWNQNSIKGKVIAVKDGIDQGIEKFERYVVDSNGREIRSEAALQEKVSELKSISVSNFLTLEGSTAIFLGVAALIFIAAGKMLSGVYSRLGKPDWYYYVIISGAIILMVGLLYTYLQVQSASSEIEQQTVKTSVASKNLSEAKSRAALGGGFDAFDSSADSSSNSEQLQEVVIYEQEAEKLSNLQAESNKFDGILKVFAFLAETLIGAWAWMTLSDYFQKRIYQAGGAEGRLKQIDNQISEVQEKLASNRSEISHLNEDNSLIASLIPRLQALLSSIVTREKIDTIKTSFREQEIAFAEQILQKHTHTWGKIDR